MGWLVALPCLAALYVLNKKFKFRRPKLRTAATIATMVVAVGVGIGLAFTFAGDWTASLVSWIAGLFNDQHAEVGVAVAMVVLFGGIAVADIAVDHEADKPAQFAAIIIPTLLLLVVGGSAGQKGGDAVHTGRDRLATVVMDIGGSGLKKGHP